MYFVRKWGLWLHYHCIKTWVLYYIQVNSVMHHSFMFVDSSCFASFPSQHLFGFNGHIPVISKPSSQGDPPVGQIKDKSLPGSYL